MYSSASLDGTTNADPTGLALACLGCHDGVQGIDIFGSHIGDAATQILNTSGDYGAGAEELTYGLYSAPNLDASREHPISIGYDNVADPGLNDPAVATIGTAGNEVIIERRLEADGADLLVQCHSCHDVHNSPGGTNDEWLLREKVLSTGGGDSGSDLCLACHNK